MILAIILGLMLVHTSTCPAATIRVCIDPGHGGFCSDPNNPPPAGYRCGADGLDCYEKDMNLNVGLAMWWIIRPYYNYVPILTRTADVITPYADRIAVPDRNGAAVYISIHHEGLPSTSPRHHTTYGLWCEQQLGGYAQPSEMMAQRIIQGIHSFWGASRGLSLGTSVEDYAHAQEHKFTRNQRRPTMIGEPCGATHTAANELCDPIQYNTSAYDQASGYFWGLVAFTGITSVNTSFTAVAYQVGGARLTWEESDPGRTVVYQLYRGDHCWGPWTHLADIVSRDAAYTSDGVHYQYTTSAQYNRPYWFRLKVSGEDRLSSMVPVSTSPPQAIGTPLGLGASQTASGGIDLAWMPSAGVVDGYHVYRGRYRSIDVCEDPIEYLGLTTTLSYHDAAAPANVPLFYRVRGFNSTASSGLSNEAPASVPPSTDVLGGAILRTNGVSAIAPNPTSNKAAITYSLRKPVSQRFACMTWLAGLLLALTAGTQLLVSTATSGMDATRMEAESALGCTSGKCVSMARPAQAELW